MDKATLLIFIQRILTTGSSMKAGHSLRELRRIFDEQGFREQSAIVNDVLDSIPEVIEEAKKGSFSLEEIDIAKLRAKKRREIEMMAARQNRC